MGFVYGPGEGGMTIEYLHSGPTGSADRLLTRAGNVQNLGGNFFQLDFPTSLLEYDVRRDANGDEKLASGPYAASGVRLEGGASASPPAFNLIVQSTYLSERLWIIRSQDRRNVA